VTPTAAAVGPNIGAVKFAADIGKENKPKVDMRKYKVVEFENGLRYFAIEDHF